jgi:hypothetical protein
MDTSNPTDKQEPTEENSLSEQTNSSDATPTTTNEIVQPTPPPSVTPKLQNSSVTLVLQWLSYASWLWFSGAILWLSASVIGYFIQGANGYDTVEVVAYPVAAVIVLLLVASVVDFFYARREPEHKEGFATVIMVIHAVIFALCGIGMLITTVFTLINLLIQGGAVNSSGKLSLVILLMSLVGLVVYIALIARTTLVAKVKRLPLIAIIIMAVFGVGFVIAAFTGPVANAIVAKQDKQLETALPDVAYAVDNYVHSNGKLPNSLESLDFSNSYYGGSAEDTKAVVAQGLVKYTPNTKAPRDEGSIYYAQGEDLSVKSGESIKPSYMTYYYRLCVTWHAEKKTGGYTTDPVPADDLSSTSGVSSSVINDPSYITTYTHKKGEQCYDLSSTSY